MSIYSKKQKWKIWLFASALIIVFASIWYSDNLVDKIAADEREKVKLWAEAVQKKAKLVRFTNDLFSRIKTEERKKVELYAAATKQLTNDLADLTFVLRVLQDNTTVPVIVTNGSKITGHRNLDSSRVRDSTYLHAELEQMKKDYPPIEIEYLRGKKNFIYYKDSRVFSDIKLVFDSLIKSFISEVAVNSASVPVIYTDSSKQEVLAFGKVDSLIISNPGKLSEKLSEMASQNPPLVIELGNGEQNFIFYEQSFILRQLKYFPYVQFVAIGLFLLIAYSLFSIARNAEQNMVWVGLSKETAHQLGTPLSSLMAWLEILKGQGTDPAVINELTRDIERLNTITERFSKVGSQPVLQPEPIVTVIENAIDYLRTRTSKNVSYEVSDKCVIPVNVSMSVPLFEWVIENLCKNAVDAMDGKGSIQITVSEQEELIHVDVRDTGKGIPKSRFKTVFEPGYTTKQRGWGLGLSLTKRIIETYHKGKIFVLDSSPEKGTTFRISLKREN